MNPYKHLWQALDDWIKYNDNNKTDAIEIKRIVFYMKRLERIWLWPE